MARTKFPTIVGVNQLADETSMVAEDKMFVRKAANVDIDSIGNVSRRKGQQQLLAGSGFHSIYSAKRGWLLVCQKHQLGIFDPDAAIFTPLANMDDAYKTSYTEMNGNLYAMNPSFACMFKPDTYEAGPLGVELPNVTPQFTATYTKGSLLAGRYGLTYSVVDPDGEESGLGPIVELELEEQGAIVGMYFTLMAGYRYRLYMTTVNGEELYQVAEFDADTVSYDIMEHEGGRQPATKYLQQPPNGHIIRAFNSRLLIGSTDFVYFTEAFRPHLHDAAHGFVPITGVALMVEALTEGVFIGDRRGVRFYRGKDPEQWEVSEASPDKVVFNTSAVVPGSFFTGPIAQFDSVVVWLTNRGYQVGLPTGEVVKLNAGQVDLPHYIQGCTAYTIRDGRKQLVSPVNSNELAHAGVALDSSII